MFQRRYCHGYANRNCRGSYSSTAGLTINAATGDVTLGTSTPGTYTVTYTIAASGGCALFTTTASITITAAPAATISYTGSPYCTSGGTATVTQTGTAGGTYTSTAGLIINASTGEVTLGTSTPGTYTVTYTIAAAGGCALYTTTASITINICANNADLAITKTDGVTTYTPGGTTTYTIVASNAGPDAATGVTVTDNFPAGISSVAWTATYAGGATGPANGAGNINATVNLPTGGSATFTAVCTISGATSGNLVNTATVTVTPGDNDPNPGNNSATDTDTQLGACAPLTVNAPTVTQPDCATATGTIVINAGGSGTLEYSIDGITYQASATFSGLAPAAYYISARYVASPLCGFAYSGNPVVISGPSSRVQTVLAGTSPFQDSLWTVRYPGLTTILTHLGPTLSGFTITGINGLATHPMTGEHYSILKVSGVSGRVLAKINLQTGVCTQIGNLGDNFSSITFRYDGQLFGVTGDGATVPETLYLIDHTNATKTLVRALGAGADGEVICYNPDDNFIYHWSGNGTVVYEKYKLFRLMALPVYLSQEARMVKHLVPGTKVEVNL
ncbi:MAG: DUF11 domain-containing protein [Chitinophagaceae bacterium]|nr:DUF11 domain-containing protein [Chitinophagaceae bacterium]